VRDGRRRKALQFAEGFEVILGLADEADDVADACVTLAVHAGVAASDVICCARLGRHARGESHTDAVALLATVDQGLARHLNTLLGLKTRAGYGHEPVTAASLVKARRAMTALIEGAGSV
jgi:hypothetical protein